MMKYAIILLILLDASFVLAQDESEHLSAFATGAGRTYAITPRGLDASDLNPSLLALGTPKPIELSILPLSSFGINAGASFGSINSIANGFANSTLANRSPTGNQTTVGDSTRESLANLLSSNKLSSVASGRVFGISYYDETVGGLALSWTVHAAVRANIPNEMLQFLDTLAYRNLVADQLTTQSLDLQAMWYSEFTLSYGRILLGSPRSGDIQLLGGLGLKYIAGIAMMRMNPGSFSINPDHTTPTTITANYAIQFAYSDVFNPNDLPSGISTNLLSSATAGSGFGGDIGFTLGAFDSNQYAPWQAAVSVADIGSIRWTKHTDLRTANVTETISLQGLSTDIVNKQLNALAGTLDKTAPPFTTQLPTTLHFAGALDLAELGLDIDGSRVSAAAEYALGLTDVVGSPNHGRFGFAAIVEHPDKDFPFHTALGFTTQDGITDITAAFGVILSNSVLIDVATAGLLDLFKSDASKDALLGIKLLL
jgi:hypothetical protein